MAKKCPKVSLGVPRGLDLAKQFERGFDFWEVTWGADLSPT